MQQRQAFLETYEVEWVGVVMQEVGLSFLLWASSNLRVWVLLVQKKQVQVLQGLEVLLFPVLLVQSVDLVQPHLALDNQLQKRLV